VPGRSLLACVLLLSSLAHSAFASASASAGITWYVRPDGGTAAQCTGRSDTPQRSAGKSRDCAWNHPFAALPPGAAARIEGGDTLLIRRGDYRMGFGAPGSERCAREYPWDCYMAALPSGRAGQPTRISGADADGVCRRKPELWGSERAARVLNLDGSRHVRVDCLEITDRSACIEQHCHGGNCRETVRCNRERFPFGDWSATGLYAADSADVELLDLDIHGMAMRGIHAGRLRDWTLRRVRIVGNGWSGWDGDIGRDKSANAGTLRFEQVEIAWNGCAEGWPERRPFGCWGSSSGGYGDGLGIAASGGHWQFDDVHVHHNASDGIDLLYLEPGARVDARRLRLHGNAGNQFKASGKVRLQDSEIDGDCAALAAHGNLQPGDLCRALGNAVSLVLHPGVDVELSGNRIRGAGDCLVVVEGGAPSSRVLLADNRLSGRPLWSNPGRRACGFYAHQSEADLRFERNSFLGVRARQCPAGSRCGAAED
jgi:hypothetical protein